MQFNNNEICISRIEIYVIASSKLENHGLPLTCSRHHIAVLAAESPELEAAWE